jgi:plastocyanin
VDRRRRIFIIAILTIGVLALSAPFQNLRAANNDTVEVAIDNFSFTPSTLKVKVGTQITWTNRDDIPHTVVSEDQVLKSKVLDTGEKFTFTPTKSGTYEYFCSIHPKMTGKIVVE